MARAKTAKTKASDEPVIKAVRVLLEPSREPVYANFAEVSAAQHEFQISFALTPSRPTAETIEQAKTGEMRLETTVQVLLPPTIIPGLIKALTTTKEQYEAMVGPIKALDA
jgi:Protein of unknown function (DUF3467)